MSEGDGQSAYITWENFNKNYLSPGIPAAYSISGAAMIEMYVSEKASRIGLRIYIDELIPLPITPLKELFIELKNDNKKYYIDFSTSNCGLYKNFYSMMIFVIDSIQVGNKKPVESILDAVERLRDLISNVNLLSEEKIIGLWGELWVLDKLLDKYGDSAVSYWKGPDRSVHDFRFEKVEIEVKTTKNEERIHVISRLTQLEPSPECVLFVCSIQVVENSTTGLSLPEYVEINRNKLQKNKVIENYFDAQLAKEGYSNEQKQYYNTRYYLRTEPELIEITNNTPRLRKKMITDLYGEKNEARFSDVQYRLNMSGFGFGASDPRYKKMFD